MVLNGVHGITLIKQVSTGLVNCPPHCETFADTLKERALVIVIAHNHPSGNREPSNNDKDVTIKNQSLNHTYIVLDFTYDKIMS